MRYLLLLVSIATAQQDLCHGYTQKMPITITPQKYPEYTVNTVCFKSKGVDTDAVFWLLMHHMYDNKQVKNGIYIDKVAVKLNSNLEPQKQFSMGRPIFKPFINYQQTFSMFNMECAIDLDDHHKAFAVFEAHNFQMTFALLDSQNEVSQKTHALTNVKLNGVDYRSDSDLYVSGVYKGGTIYISLTLFTLTTESEQNTTPALLAWNKDGTIKHFISFGRKDGIYDVANDMILNPKGDNLYVATTFYKTYVKDGVEGEGLYPVISRYNIETGEQQYQYEENFDAKQEYIFMALSDNGSKVLICTECELGYQIEIIYASMSIFNNFIPEHQYYDFYEKVDKVMSRRRLRTDTSLFNLIQSKTDNMLSSQRNSRPFRCTGAFISGNGQKGGMLYMKTDWESQTVQHKTLFSTDLSQSQMYEQIIEYKNHDSLYFAVPKSGVYNFRENYFTFALSHQFTKLNFGQKTYATVIMNSKQVNQDNCSILTDQLVFTAERQFTNEGWTKAEIYQESSLEPSSKVQYLLATHIFSGEFSQENLIFNDLSFDVSSKYPFKFLSMCYEGVVPQPPEVGAPTKLSLAEPYVDHEIWSNESRSYSHLALEGKCGAPRTGVTYEAIISPTDPCATYDKLTYTASFKNCTPNAYAITFKATLPGSPQALILTSDFFVVTVKKYIPNEAPVFETKPEILLVCGNEEGAVCFNNVKLTDPNEGDSQMLEYDVKKITLPSIKKTDLTDHVKAQGYFDNQSSTATSDIQLYFKDDPNQQKIEVAFKYAAGMQHSKSEFYIVRVQFRDTFRPSDVKKTEFRYFYLFYFPKENVEAAFLKPDNSNYLAMDVVQTNNKQPIGVPITFDIPTFREKNIKSLIYNINITIEDLNDATIDVTQLYNPIQNITYSDSYNKQGDAIYTSFADIKGLKFTVAGTLPVGMYRINVKMAAKSHAYLQSPSLQQITFLSWVVYDIKVVSDNSPPSFKTLFLDYVFDTYKGDLWNVTIPQFGDPNLNDKLFIKFEGLPQNQSIEIIGKQEVFEGEPEVLLELLSVTDFVELNRNSQYFLQFKTSNETALAKYQIRAVLKDNDSVKEGVIEQTSDNFTVQFIRKTPKPPKNDTEVDSTRNDTPKVVVVQNYTDYKQCREGEFPSFTAIKYNEVISIEAKIYSEYYMQFQCSTYFFLYKIELPENGSLKIFSEHYRSLRVDPKGDKSLIGNYLINAYIYNELDAKKELTLFGTFKLQIYEGDKHTQSLDGIDLPKGKDYKDIVKISEVSQSLKFELKFKSPVEFMRKDENKEFKEYRKLLQEGSLNVTIDVWLESQSAQTFESSKAFSGYKVIQKSPENLEVTIDSTALLKLSQSLKLDFIIVEITNNQFNPWTNLDTFKTLILKSQIPRVTLNQEADTLVAFSAILVVVLFAAFGLNLVYNLVIAKERVNLAVYLFLSLQYICSFQDLQIVVPRNLKLILEGLTRFTYLRPFPLSLGGFSDDQVMLSETGTGPNMLQNNGILIIIFIFVCAISFVSRFTKIINRNIVQKIQGAFLVISYLILTTSSLRNLFFFSTSSGSQSISAIISILVVFILVSLPIFLFLVYANELYGFNIRSINSLKVLKNLVFKNDIEEKNKFEAQQMIFAVFIFHRLVYLVCREAFYSTPSILLGIAALNQAIIAARILKHQPYSQELVTKFTIIISEVILLIMLYFVSSFSEGQPSQKIRYETAKAFIFLLYIYMSFAVLALVSDSVLKKKLRQKLKIAFEILPQGRRDVDYEISNELDLIKPLSQIHSSSKIELQKKQTRKEQSSSESESGEEGEDEQNERFQADHLYTRSQAKIPTKVDYGQGQTLVFPQNLMRAVTIKQNDQKQIGKLFLQSAIEEEQQDSGRLERVSVDTSEYPESYGGPYQKLTKDPHKNRDSDEDQVSQEDQGSDIRSQKSSDIEKRNKVSTKLYQDGVFNPSSGSENQSEQNSDDEESQDKVEEEYESSKSDVQQSEKSSQQEESKQETSQKSETEQTSEAAEKGEAESSKQETSQQVEESSQEDSNQAKTESSEESN